MAGLSLYALVWLFLGHTQKFSRLISDSAWDHSWRCLRNHSRYQEANLRWLHWKASTLSTILFLWPITLKFDHLWDQISSLSLKWFSVWHECVWGKKLSTHIHFSPCFHTLSRLQWDLLRSGSLAESFVGRCGIRWWHLKHESRIPGWAITSAPSDFYWDNLNHGP